VQSSFSFEVEGFVLDGVGLRRFRWRLKGAEEPERPSSESFATKREASMAGEIALQRVPNSDRDLGIGMALPLAPKRPLAHRDLLGVGQLATLQSETFPASPLSALEGTGGAWRSPSWRDPATLTCTDLVEKFRGVLLEAKSRIDDAEARAAGAEQELNRLRLSLTDSRIREGAPTDRSGP